jgi:hypothetical protein
MAGDKTQPHMLPGTLGASLVHTKLARMKPDA